MSNPPSSPGPNMQRPHESPVASVSPRRPDDARSNSGSRSGWTWTIDGFVATHRIDPSATAHCRMMEARIHLDRPASGITFGGEVDVERPIHLLGLSLDAAAERAAGGHGGALVPTDRWARGDDVVAVYEPQDSRALRATAMWRRLATANAAVTAWELIISCQTSLLESDATVVVRSRVPASGFAVPSSPPDRRWSDASRGDALETLPSEAILARISSGPTVLVAAHRLDARRLTIQSVSARPANGEPAADIEYWLFPSVVEKGVLLRGRVLAAIGPRESDTEWASGLIDAFNASPPPLTA